MWLHLCFLLFIFLLDCSISHGKRRPNNDNDWMHKVFLENDFCCGEKPTNQIQFPDVCMKQIKDANHHKIACMLQCLGKSVEMIDEKGTINQSKFMEFYKSYDSDTSRQSLVEASLTKCIEKMTDALKDISEALDNNEDCSPQLLILIQCVKRKTLLSCPEDKQVNTERCQQVRERVKKYDADDDDD